MHMLNKNNRFESASTILHFKRIQGAMNLRMEIYIDARTLRTPEPQHTQTTIK